MEAEAVQQFLAAASGGGHCRQDFFERVRIKRVDIKISRNTEDVPVFSFILCFMSGLLRFCWFAGARK